MNATATTTLWHNPRCSKSRATLALLQENGVEPAIRLYLDQTPTAEEVAILLQQLGLSVRAVMRTGEDAYKELGLANTALSDQDLINAIVSHPKLLERPIAVHNNHARIGRPPEHVLELYS
jgi:arsenate reductase